MSPNVTLAYDPNRIQPGWIAFWIVVALGVATFLLWRSMNTQLRKINVPPARRRPCGSARRLRRAQRGGCRSVTRRSLRRTKRRFDGRLLIEATRLGYEALPLATPKENP